MRFGALIACLVALISQPSLTFAERIALYIGSFDPPHLGHKAMVDKALNEAGIQRVLVVPQDLTPHKPFRSRTQDRLEMLRVLFENDPRVIIPQLDWGVPLVSGALKSLGDRRNFELSFIAGDDVFNNPFQAWLIEISLHIDSWILFPRKSKMTGTSNFRGRPAIVIERTDFEKSRSSRKIREAIRASRDPKMDQESLGVALSSYIEKAGIYAGPKDARERIRLCLGGLRSLVKRIQTEI